MADRGLLARSRVELGTAPERGFGGEAFEGVEQPVGCGMDEKSELVGRRLGAGGAVRGEVQLVRLEQVLGLAMAAIEDLVEPA